jgi:hypothetical protein
MKATFSIAETNFIKVINTSFCGDDENRISTNLYKVYSVDLIMGDGYGRSERYMRKNDMTIDQVSISETFIVPK